MPEASVLAMAARSTSAMARQLLSVSVSGKRRSHKLPSTRPAWCKCCASLMNCQWPHTLVKPAGASAPNHFTWTPPSAQACTKRAVCAWFRSITENCSELATKCSRGRRTGKRRWAVPPRASASPHSRRAQGSTGAGRATPLQPIRRQDWAGLSPQDILARYRIGHAPPAQVLEVLLELFNTLHTSLEKSVSHKTRQERAQFLRRFFRDLNRKAGFMPRI